MKVKDYVSVIKGEVSINITFDGKKITEFKAPYWDTIEADILDLEIRSVAFPGKSVIIETKTGRPTIVSTPAELEAAITDENIKFIKLGADITDSLNFASGQKILDLAGHELVASSDDYAIYVSGESVLDIFDSECGALVRGNSSLTACESAKVNVHSGDYVCGSDVDGGVTVYAFDDSKICIYGGYFVNIAYDGIDNVVFHTSENGTITCYGGKCRDQDPAEYVADGYQAVEIPDTDPVVYEVKSIL